MTPPRLLAAPVLAAACCAAAFSAAVPASVEAQAPPPRVVLLDDETELQAALASRTPPRGLLVRVAGVSVPDRDPAKAQLLIVAEIGDQAGGARTMHLASVFYVIEDQRGQVRARQLRRRELSLSTGGRLAFAEGVALAPGSYRVRLAAMRNAKVGVADATVDVRLHQAGRLRFGDLAVGAAAGNDLASSLAVDRAVRGEHLVASLPFSAGDGALPDDLGVVIEAARDAAGPALLSAPAAVTPVSADGVAMAQGVLDLRALPAGDYVVRANVSVGGREAARFTAPFTRERAAAAAIASSSPPPAAARPPGTRSAVPGNAFRSEDVLDRAVLGPFLDELALRVSDRAKPAIEEAKAGRFSEAARSAAAADPEGPAKPFLQGLSLFSQGQLQSASEAFRDTLRAAPDYFVGAFYIGACYAAGGRDSQAVNAWQTSLVGLEGHPIVFRLLADALTRMGQPERAVEALEEALAKWPDDADVRLRAARAALEARRYDRVFALVDGGLERQPPADLLLAGVRAVFEQVSQRAEAAGDESIARARRYREAYAAAGGTQQALVSEWLAAIERKK